MLIFENIALAFSGLWANKMRALLTMLGIIIGIGSVIAIVTVGNSMSQGLNEEMQNMGASNVTVYVTQRRTEEENMQMGGMTMATSFSFAQFSEQDNLTDDMIAKYRQQLADKIKYISINTRVDGNTAKSGKLTSDVSIMGVNDDYLKVTGVELLTGRAINEKDEANHRKVCIVSNQLTNKLFPNQDPIGKKVDLKINNDLQTYYIVGVYKQSDSEMRYSMTGTASTNVYLPISTAKAASNSAPGYQEITVMPEVGVDNETFIAETNAFFEKMYKKNKNYYAEAYSMQGMVDEMQKTTQTVSLAISVIAGISLLVGGIGVMNIMLVSITERTREIGTRKALGATNGSIMAQFIIEAVIICLAGGIIGILLGVGLGSVGSNLLGYAASPSVGIILISVVFSMVIGVFFGFYPARKAAKLDPIEALRYE